MTFFTCPLTKRIIAIWVMRLSTLSTKFILLIFFKNSMAKNGNVLIVIRFAKLLMDEFKERKLWKIIFKLCKLFQETKA